MSVDHDRRPPVWADETTLRIYDDFGLDAHVAREATALYNAALIGGTGEGQENRVGRDSAVTIERAIRDALRDEYLQIIDNTVAEIREHIA